MAAYPSISDDPEEISSSYIYKVQNLIERCLLLYMDRDQCINALHKYANVKPVVTRTVWNELVKVNEDFFSVYFKTREASFARVFKGRVDSSVYATTLSSSTIDCSRPREKFQLSPGISANSNT